jgi:hypothetical protein
MIPANLQGMITQQNNVHQAIIQLFDAMMPDGQYDPAEDTRQEQPFEDLAALVGTSSAKGIQSALNIIMNRYFTALAGNTLDDGDEWIDDQDDDKPIIL